jgi:hypothetical protein
MRETIEEGWLSELRFTGREQIYWEVADLLGGSRFTGRG